MDRQAFLTALIIPAALAAALLASLAASRVQGADDSPHGPIALECTVCHQEDWSVPARPRAFDHGATTGFALAGRHERAACRDCHRDVVFTAADPGCVSCHTDVHRGQNGPRCERCHEPTGWKRPASVAGQHAARGFPLVGAHAAADCEACHVGRTRQEFAGTPSRCHDCHAAEYEATADPDHRAAGFDTDCSRCHQPTPGWRPVHVQHTPRFPLRHAHARAGCRACHPSIYAGTSPLCYSCHQADYEGTSDPPHGEAGFPTTCEQCHSDAGWEGARFDHAARTGFALVGAHARAQCTACHVHGTWSGLPRACYDCHSGDYLTATNPSHAAAGFPTTCETCHTPNGWRPSSWSHTRFPIYSGRHAGAWSACSDCHTAPADFGVFSCTTCHACSEVAPRHSEVGGFQCVSDRCYSCHPDGRADDR